MGVTMKNGMMIAGNILQDTVKTIRSYPSPGLLSTIEEVSQSVGGCVPNTAIDLARMESGIPLYVAGCIGKDAAGEFVLNEMKRYGINTDGVRVSTACATSFSDVISARDTGERTFFHYRGANAEFSPRDVNPEALPCSLLHIGYILLLDRFDEPDDEYGTAMARFLCRVQQQGILTSIDVVSDAEGRFAQKVKPALSYCDYAIMNEIEGGMVSGMACRRPDGTLDREQIRNTLLVLKKCGVRKRAVIHAPEAGFCVDEAERFIEVPSLALPKGYIQGSVGAGDAFCAGCLHEIYFGSSAEEMLSYAAAAAAANLSAKDSVSGMRSEAEIKAMMNTMSSRTL